VPWGIGGQEEEARLLVAWKQGEDELLGALEAVEGEEESLGALGNPGEDGKAVEDEALFHGQVKSLETDSPRWMRQMASAKRGATARVFSLGPSFGGQVSVAATSFTGLLAMRSRAGPT